MGETTAQSRGPARPWWKGPALWTLLGGLIVGSAGGFYGGRSYERRNRVSRPRKPIAPAYIAIAAHNPRMGANPAKVVIIEFSDFQCPFCGRAQATVKRLLEEHAGDLALVFKQHPLGFHKNAPGAARAMLAANRQDKGWQMHDLMFANRKALSESDLERYAEKLGLDIAKFKADIKLPEIADQVAADTKAALTVGATGTPMFFVNGRPVRGAKPYAAFKKIIEEELVRADAELAKGTPLERLYETIAKARK